MTQKPHFLLDMDGVISDIFSGLLTFLNETYSRDVDIESYLSGGGTYDVGKFYGLSNKDLWEEIIPEEKKFWLDMPAFPWTLELYNFLRSQGEVTIVSKPTKDPQCSVDKLIWLKRVLNIDRDDVFLGAKKYLMAGNGILIDDYPGNIEEFRLYGGKAILLPSNWNTSNLSFELIKNTIIQNLQ